VRDSSGDNQTASLEEEKMKYIGPNDIEVITKTSVIISLDILDDTAGQIINSDEVLLYLSTRYGTVEVPLNKLKGFLQKQTGKDSFLE